MLLNNLLHSVFGLRILLYSYKVSQGLIPYHTDIYMYTQRPNVQLTKEMDLEKNATVLIQYSNCDIISQENVQLDNCLHSKPKRMTTLLPSSIYLEMSRVMS